MVASFDPFYGPALRMKAGELQGLRDLSGDVADCIIPRLIVPPKADRDDSLQARLFECTALPDIATPLAAHWPGRDVLVEATHLIEEFGRDKLGDWYPLMFDRARAAMVQAIPLVQVGDLQPATLAAYAAAINFGSNIQFGLVLSSGDVVDHEAIARAISMMASMGLALDRCVVVIDFHDADLSNPDVVAPIIGGSLDYLRSVAPWQHVIFQGTNFPSHNPADTNSYKLVPRNEWIAWQKAVAFDPHTANYLAFGDYAADCAKLVFGKSGGRAIRHYRYTTPDAWYVQRGASEGKDQYIMEQVCQEILNSGYFAGRAFSSADNYIFLTAKRLAGPGNAGTWRAVNTTHHITCVVKDMGRVLGRRFVERPMEALVQQDYLF